MPILLQRRTVSGARVLFDPRTTAEANMSRDMTNRVKRPSRKPKKAKHGATDRR
jgi:hypothetical protein